MSDERPTGFHHVALKCANLQRCERFYIDVLGLKVLRRWPGTGGEDRSVWLAVGEGGAFLALERATEGQKTSEFREESAGIHLIALRISQAERAPWEEKLKNAGVPIVHRTRWTLYLRDPEGNRIGLSHHPEDA